MGKKIVNEDRFIELCNEELRNHPGFVEGMRVETSPEGASGSGIGGYRLAGPKDQPGVLREVVDKVKANYELKLTNG